MEQSGGRQGGSNFLQLLILIMLGAVICIQLVALQRMRELGGEEAARQVEAQIEAPVPDFGIPAKVVKINPDSRTLEIERKRKSGKTYKRLVQFTDKTQVVIAGKPAEFKDLKEGLNIRLKGSMEEDNVLRAIEIHASPPVQ